MTRAAVANAPALPAGWKRRGDAGATMPADHNFLIWDGPRSDAVVFVDNLVSYAAEQCYSEDDGAQAWRTMGWYATPLAAMTALDVFAQAKAAR